jgi:hypothetical protein
MHVEERQLLKKKHVAKKANQSRCSLTILRIRNAATPKIKTKAVAGNVAASAIIVHASALHHAMFLQRQHSYNPV